MVFMLCPLVLSSSGHISKVHLIMCSVTMNCLTNVPSHRAIIQESVDQCLYYINKLCVGYRISILWGPGVLVSFD